jgi:hypothetical protein
VGWLAVPEPTGSLLAATGFGVAGGLCVGNAARCRRTHCIVTGPLYLLAVLVLLSRVVGALVVPAGLIVATSIVGTILAYIPEWLGLRYFPRRNDVTPTVQLLYDNECPNVSEARANLEQALAAVGLPPSWAEKELTSRDTPPEARTFGSPTVLVNGRDVAGGEPGDAASCRVYQTADRQSGAPSVDLIARALTLTCSRRPSG